MTTKKVRKENPLKDQKTDIIKGDLKKLILHNDEEHTFDYVIDSLIEVCNHNSTQAEQCAFITHHKGKCDVKKGDITFLRPMRTSLAEKGLKVSID